MHSRGSTTVPTISPVDWAKAPAAAKRTIREAQTKRGADIATDLQGQVYIR